MPRKTASNTDKIENDVKKVSSSKKKSVTASATKAVSKKTKSENSKVEDKSSTKKVASKKVSIKQSSEKKATKSTSKKSTTKSKVAKTSTKSSSSTAKKSKSSKSTSKRSSVKKLSSAEDKKITATSNLTKKIEILEYYDLPYRYNQTIVKVLAQTPTTLFVYWDISDVDRENFIKTYGDNFFNDTKPVLVIHNITMNYSYEIDIDDFANSWYLHVNDSNCEYSVELGRKPKYKNEEFNIPNNYLFVTSSNVMDSPNDHILFDKNLQTVYFRDVKTNIITAKDITSISFLRNMGKIYSLYELQGYINEDVFINNNSWRLDLKNPSSSSTFK